MARWLPKVCGRRADPWGEKVDKVVCGGAEWAISRKRSEEAGY